MNNLRKKSLIAAFLIILGTAPAISAASMWSNLYQAATKTKLRTLVTGTLAAYALHRTVQSIARQVTTTLEHAKLASTAPERVNATGPVVTIGVHGFGDSGIHFKEFIAHTFRIPANQIIVPEMQDSRVLPAGQDRASCLGQAADIAIIKRTYDAEIAKGNRVRFIAVSRGASALIMFLGLCKPNPRNIESIICQSPFDDVENVAAHLIRFAGKIPLLGGMITAAGLSAASWISHNMLRSLASRIPNPRLQQQLTQLVIPINKHSVYYPRPKDVAPYISKELRILFICSLEDELVPASGTDAVYEVTKPGNPNCYEAVLEHGKHNEIPSADSGAHYLETCRDFLAHPNRCPRHAK